MTRLLQNEAETEAFGAELLQALPGKCVIFLRGQLGAGKTTLVRGLLRAAGYHGKVKSPTFTLVEEYSLDACRIFHFDLYRLADPEELEWIGIRDYVAQQAICFIEWPEMGAGYLPEPDMIIELTVAGNARQLCIEKPLEASKKNPQ